jgi:hypothetical protein
MSEFNNNFLARIQEGLRGEEIMNRLRQSHHEESKLLAASQELVQPKKQNSDSEMLNQSMLHDEMGEGGAKAEPMKQFHHTVPLKHDVEMIDTTHNSPLKLTMSKSLSMTLSL